MKVLVLNCGSSTVKFQLIETDAELIAQNADRFLARGTVEKIGTPEAIVHYQVGQHKPVVTVEEILDHKAAIAECLSQLQSGEDRLLHEAGEIGAVGHRVVHGGERFSGSQLMDEEVVAQIRDCIELAPLHNPHNLKGYEVCRRLLPGVPQVAVFDTAFHQSMAPEAYLYGLPYLIYKRHRVRRYGFHGTSHRYVAYRYRQVKGLRREQVNAITCHLGNGSSVCAIQAGKSVDTSMGFTPLEGLVMGSRCGDVDPAVILHVMSKEELSLHEATTLLNKHSGLYGISGISGDMRELLRERAEGNPRATLAVDLFCYRLRKYIGAYCGVLGRVDALIFTGGIGENAPLVRAAACQRLDFFGIELDNTLNQETVGTEALISTRSSRTEIYVIPTNEELLIARDAVRTVLGLPPPA
ncbi:MAG: acetate kinase [Acidobacteriota bacterium]